MEIRCENLIACIKGSSVGVGWESIELWIVSGADSVLTGLFGESSPLSLFLPHFLHLEDRQY